MAVAIPPPLAISKVDTDDGPGAPKRPVSKLVLGVNPPCPNPFVADKEEGIEPNIGASALAAFVLGGPDAIGLTAVGVAAGVVAVEVLLL